MSAAPSTQGSKEPPVTAALTGSSSTPASKGDKSTAMSKALAKAQAQRELQQQRAAELKVGEEWNETFRTKGNIRNVDVLAKFWAEVKIRLGRKFGSIQIAFRKLDASGDGQISFLEFCDMVALINMPMDQRVLRQLFDKASGGDRALSMEELKTLLLDKTIRKLRFLMEGFNSKQERVQTYIHRFIRRLALNDQTSRLLAIDRFQRKISIEFCRDVWQMLRKDDADSTGREPFNRDDFSKAMEGFVVKEAGVRLLAYEIIFMERLFDRVDQRRNGSVVLVEFVMTLLLLSGDSDKLAKVALGFDCFDTDADGCLQFEQIMQLFLCMTKQRPLVEDNLRIMYELDFQDELCTQEGRHAYELVLWHLQRSIKVEGGIVTKRELIEALEHLPQVSEALVPGVVRMRWALQPSWAEGDDPPSPVWPPRRTPMAPPSPTCAPPSQSSASVKEATALMSSSANRRTSFPAGVPQLMPAPRRGPPGHGANGVRTRGPRVVWKSCDEGVKFRNATTSGFQKSLRNLGNTRLTELTYGFTAPPEIKQDNEEEGAGGEADMGPRLSLSRQGGMSRSASAPQLAGASCGSGAACAGGASAGGRRTMAGRKAAAHHGLSSNAPADVKRLAGELMLEMNHRELSVPTLFSEKWGTQSIDRFRLYSAATATAAGRRLVDRPVEGSHIWHKCYVCLGTHRLSFGDCSK